MPVSQFANPATQRSRPDRAVATLINRIDAVLCQAIGLRVRMGRESVVAVAQMGQPPSPSPDPQPVRTFRDGIDYILTKPVVRHSPRVSSSQPVQPTLKGGEPCSFLFVDVNRSTVSDRLGEYRVGVECAVAQAPKASHPANPEVSFSILKQRSHRLGAPASTPSK